MQHAIRSGIFLLALSVTSVSPADTTGAPALTALDGAEIFAQLCASCHGKQGRGDGPVAPAMKAAPPDLTLIAARNGRRFPADWVRDVIDGRAVLPAHGTRAMPVWGYELEASVAEREPGRAAAVTLTNRLVDFLESIQR